MQSFIRHGLTEQEAVSETLLQLMGGSDTSATASKSPEHFILYLHLLTSVSKSAPQCSTS